MGDFQLFVLGSLGLLTFIVVIWAGRLKKVLGTMQGMIISMFYGMNVGLTAGILLGVTYQGDLFLSTIISIAIGVLAGSLCGLRFGILSVLEGFMAGVMGGMMGAMVGEMIHADQSISLVQIFLFLSVSTIYIIAIVKTPHNAKVHTKKWLLKPMVISTFIAVYLIGGNTIAEKNRITGESSSSNSHHSATSNSTEKLDREGQIIALDASDMKYSNTKIIVEKNREVILTLTNLDNIEHDIEIKVPSLQANNESHHNHNTGSNVIHLHASPKSSETLTFTPTESGVYEFYCTIPGHKEFGMIGQLIVS